MSGEEFAIKFNLQKLLGLGIACDDTGRIAQVFNCTRELIEEITLKYRVSNLKQAAIIIDGNNNLDTIDKEREITVAFIGDSITSDRESYFNILKAVFKDFENINFIDAAVSGDRTVNAMLNSHERVLKHKSHIVSIMIGTNDMQRTIDHMGISATSTGEYERNLRHIIERLLQEKAIVIINTLPPMDNYGFDYSYGEAYSRYDVDSLSEYNSIIRKLTKEYGLVLNDLSEEYLKYPSEKLLLEDGIHLSTLAQRLVAARLFAILVELMGKGNGICFEMTE